MTQEALIVGSLLFYGGLITMFLVTGIIAFIKYIKKGY